MIRRNLTVLIVVAFVTALATQVPAAEKSNIRGRVLDPSGKPVEGADVFLVNPKPFEPTVVATARSDANGAFGVQAELPGDVLANPYYFQVLAAGKGIGAERVEPKTECEIRLRGLTRITLTMLGPDGKPVAGMTVHPNYISGSSVERTGDGSRGSRFYMPPCDEILRHLTGVTDAEGKVTLNNLPRGSSVDFQFDDEHFAYPDYNQRFATSENQAESTPVTVNLELGATVTGKVGQGGKGVGGIRVLAQPTHRSRTMGSSGSALTDADGNYRITHLIPGEYNVLLNLQGQTAKDWTAVAHEWLKLRGGETTRDVDLPLIEGGIIRGKVITADTAEPIVGIQVGVHGPAHPQSSNMVASGLTNADGEYSVRVAPGLQQVSIRGILPEAYRESGQNSRDIKVDDGETARLDFRLTRREGEKVNGVVIGVDGKPASGVTVTARSERPAFASWARTDEQGRFHFDAVPVNSQIGVKFGDAHTAEPAVVQKGQGEVHLQLAPRAKVSLKGLVTDDKGVPVPNARILLAVWEGSSGRGGDPLICDANGMYELKNLYLDTRYTLSAQADGFGEKQSELPLEANQKEVPTLVLPRANATTTGVVVDEDGKPVAGVSVEMISGTLVKTAVTDAQGRFSFEVVSGIRIIVAVKGKGRNPSGPSIGSRGGNKELKLVLPKAQQ